MTERSINPSNYLDLAGGREDIAVALEQKDKRLALELRLTHALTTASLSQLEVMAATLTVDEALPVENDEVEPGAHFEGGFYA